MDMKDDLLDTTGMLDSTREESELNTSIEHQQIFHDHMERQQNSSLFDSFQLLLNTAIGSGTLMVPFCYTAGIGYSLIVAVVFATIGYFTLSFMAESGYFTHTYDYKGLFEHTFGKNRLWIINVMITCVQLGAALIYCHWNGILVPTLLETADRKDIWGSRVFWTFACAIVFVLPLCMLKNIHVLEKVAILSSITILLLIAHAIYWLFVHLAGEKNWVLDPQGKISWFNMHGTAPITSLSVNSMAYNCHLNFFTSLDHMKMSTVGRARKLALITIVTAFILYNIFGVVTYIDLIDKVPNGSSLTAYNPKNIFTKITLIGIIFMLVLSVPIVVIAARNSLNSMIFKDSPPTPLRWFLIGACVTLVAAGLAATGDDIILFFDVVGGFFTPTIIFFMPALFYIKNQRNEPKWRVIVAYVIACFTVVAVVFCLYQAFSEIIKAIKGKK